MALIPTPTLTLTLTPGPGWDRGGPCGGRPAHVLTNVQMTCASLMRDKEALAQAVERAERGWTSWRQPEGSRAPGGDEAVGGRAWGGGRLLSGDALAVHLQSAVGDHFAPGATEAGATSMRWNRRSREP